MAFEVLKTRQGSRTERQRPAKRFSLGIYLARGALTLRTSSDTITPPILQGENTYTLIPESVPTELGGGYHP